MGFQISLPRFRAAPQSAAPKIRKTPVPLDPELRITGIDGRTRISTDFGDVPAMLLRVGDKVRTKDGRFLPILAIDTIRLDAEYLHYLPEAAPIRIVAGAFGQSRPWEDVFLAPDQIVGGGLSEAEAFFCRATDLLDHPMVVRERASEATFYRFTLPEPAAVLSEKVWVRIG
jgi:hypothetical protein